VLILKSEGITIKISRSKKTRIVFANYNEKRIG